MKIKNIWKNINQNKIEIVKKEFPKIINNKFDKKALIEVKNLKKSYKKFGRAENLIFDNVSFNIYEDEVLALLGSNGSGKTTIVEIISKIKKQSSGEVILNINQNEYIEPIGVQFQDITFPKSLTVKDLISFQIRMMESKVNQNLLDEMLSAFKLKDLLNLKISKLSGGQQQRLNVLLATLSKPKVLFLDEFTTGLDIAIKNEITNFITNYAKQNKITIVLISHDIDTISLIATRFVLLADKQVVVDADKQTILKKFKSISDFLYEYIV